MHGGLKTCPHSSFATMSVPDNSSKQIMQLSPSSTVPAESAGQADPCVLASALTQFNSCSWMVTIGNGYSPITSNREIPTWELIYGASYESTSFACMLRRRRPSHIVRSPLRSVISTMAVIIALESVLPVTIISSTIDFLLELLRGRMRTAVTITGASGPQCIPWRTAEFLYACNNSRLGFGDVDEVLSPDPEVMASGSLAVEDDADCTLFGLLPRGSMLLLKWF